MDFENHSSTPLLDNIAGPADLKRLPKEKLPALAEELRREIIRVVTQTGGHLASSLGAVEFIVALHYVLDSPRDQIIFDVGHQSYAHKILTGRRERFESLRQENGLSGFPKRAESPHDHFDTGHSSTSVSAALGLACARDLKGEDRVVVAVLGDGSLTGGLALEALNHAGALKKKLLVILNDNKMSISPNVGALSEHLSLMVTKPAYVRLRQSFKEGLKRYMPRRGLSIIGFLRRLEDAFKSLFTSPSTLFETLGLRYLGPFDGHDVLTLADALKGALNLQRPVLLHVVTQKGKGYAPAEAYPSRFHGVGQVPPSGGGSSLPVSPKRLSWSEIFGRKLCQLAEEDQRLVAITAAMSEGTGLAEFFERFPQRSFDVGIAEQHAVTLAAGLAAAGLRPVAAIYSSFLQRAFDQLFHDVALQKLPVTLAVDRAGLVGEDGPTHHGGLDLSYLRLLPNFTVMAPADALELEQMLSLALSLDSPAALRYPRGAAPARLTAAPPLELGKGARLRQGRDISILTLGPQVAAALEAAELLAARGYEASVVNMRFLKPLDLELLEAETASSGLILTAEENSLTGGLFGAVSEALAGRKLRLKGLGLGDDPVQQASQARQRAVLNLDAEGIFRQALQLLEG